jgi:hypothetical protein
MRYKNKIERSIQTGKIQIFIDLLCPVVTLDRDLSSCYFMKQELLQI